MRLRERPRHYRCTPLQQKLSELYLCCSRTSAMPSSPSQKASRTTWVNGLPTIPTAANLVAESISPSTGPGREGNKRCAGAVCDVQCTRMKCGADPAQPTSIHRPITYMTPVHYSCCAQCNLVTLGIRLPIQPSAVGNRSLMWPYHITGTQGCSTPKVDNQHSLE